MNNFSNYHFFLGGHDAEMEEIGKILSANGCLFEDADLRWDNAKASFYKDKLSNLPPDKIPVLIELDIDTPIPDNAIIIDHHGKNAGVDKKTSLEQIAALLQIQLTRDQQLINANDRGHIRGMLAMGAKPEEIEIIRKMDRDAQKITEADYRLADEAITQIQEPFKDVNVALIESQTKRTAAIVDTIWDKYQIIIIKAPDNEVHITGPGKLINALKKHYEAIEKEKPEIKFWSGGLLPSYGYFGSNYHNEKEILEMAKEAIKPISQHIFLFPFMIEHWDRDNAPNLNLKDVFDKLTQKIWMYEKFSPFTSSQSYNEYGYFHDYVRTALFGKLAGQKNNSELSPCKFDLFSGETPKFVSCLLNRCSGKGDLELRIKDKKDDTFTEETYNLTIDGVSLRLFETGIAILAIELLNYKYTEFKDIQRINDYGRRVYPQFLGSDTGNEISDVKNAFLADSIKITLDSPVDPENFYLGDFFVTGHDHLHIGKHITSLMGNDFANIYRMEPIIDDRMFTICWYGNDALLARLIYFTNEEDDHPNKEQPFESSPDWYRFIFLDGKDCMCQDERTLSSLIDASTYRRWMQWGTLYGITRYSLMCLTGTNTEDFIKIHMRRQYRLIAEILLAQRASIITFFRRITDISKNIDELDEDSDVSKDRQQREAIVKNIRKLNRDFLGFKNRLWFVEVTPQEQGIEMYDMAMKNMGLEKQMEELKDEIKELYEYAEMQGDKMRMEEEKKQSDEALTLTKWATFAIPISIALAIWGMSFEFIKDNLTEKMPWLIFTISSAVLISCIMLFKKSRKKEGAK